MPTIDPIIIPGTGALSSNRCAVDNSASAKAAIAASGCNNDAGGQYSAILGGCNNTTNANYSAILGGKENTNSLYCNSFIIGSNITTDASCTTYVNNLKSSDLIKGNVLCASASVITSCLNSSGIAYSNLISANNISASTSSIFSTTTSASNSFCGSGLILSNCLNTCINNGLYAYVDSLNNISGIDISPLYTNIPIALCSVRPSTYIAQGISSSTNINTFINGSNSSSSGYCNVVINGNTNNNTGCCSVIINGQSNTTSFNHLIINGFNNNTGYNCGRIINGRGNSYSTGNSSESFIFNGCDNTITTCTARSMLILNGDRNKTCVTSYFYAGCPGYGTVIGYNNTVSGYTSFLIGASNSTDSSESFQFGIANKTCGGSTTSCATLSGAQKSTIFGRCNIGRHQLNSINGNASCGYLFGMNSYSSFSQSFQHGGGFGFDGGSNNIGLTQTSELKIGGVFNLTSGQSTSPNTITLYGTIYQYWYGFGYCALCLMPTPGGCSAFSTARSNTRMWNTLVSWSAVVQSITGTVDGISIGDTIGQFVSIGAKKKLGVTSIIGSPNILSTNSDTSMSTASVTFSVQGVQSLGMTFVAPTFTGGGSIKVSFIATMHITENAVRDT